MRRDQLIDTGGDGAGGILAQILGDPQAVIEHQPDPREQAGDFRNAGAGLFLGTGRRVGGVSVG